LKNLLKILAAILIVIAISSCEENFSPVVEYDTTYSLSCIIRGDTTLQVATLFTSYDLANGDSTTNPAYDGALVRLWYQDTVYWFKDSVISYPRYSDSKLRFYYLDNFKPAGGDESLEIEAMLKGGKKLIGKCLTPPNIRFDNGATSITIPPVDTKGVNFTWYTQNEDAVKGFYVGRLVFRYFYTANGANELRSKEIPLYYTSSGSRIIPTYPSPIKKSALIYDTSAVRTALREISEGDPNKSNYKIIDHAKFDLLVLDENASRYYSSTLEDNSFTVDVNELDYSNIDGGFGVFGSINQEQKTIRFVPEYLMSFGYDVFYEE